MLRDATASASILDLRRVHLCSNTLILLTLLMAPPPPGTVEKTEIGFCEVCFMARGTAFGKRILLVEDDLPIRNLLKVVLAQDGNVVVEAQNGLEALALFKTQQFDLVVTDFDMPEMPGDRLVLAIKQLMPSQPIILMTADRSSLREVEHVPNLVLDKPFPLQRLHSAIADLFGRSC